MEPCNQEKVIQDLIEAKGFTEAKLNSIEKIVIDIKDNHLVAIDKKLTRPSWTVCTIITILTAFCVVLLREVVR